MPIDSGLAFAFGNRHSTIGNPKMFLPKLAFTNLINRKTRVALTVAAIALSVSLVVAVTSGYASLEAAAYKFFTQYLGNTDATITPKNAGGGVPENLVDQLKHDPLVKQAVGRFETEIGLLDARRVAEVIGISRPQDTQVEQMRLERGQWFNSSDGNVAVIDQGASMLMNKDIGDEFELPGIDNERLKLKPVGVVHKPDVMASARPTIYLPLHTLQAFKHFPNELTRILITLQPNANAQQFQERWEPRLARIDPNLRLRLAGNGREILGQNLQALHLVSYMGGMVSMVAAMFIVFSSLSMGVTERQRTLGMLRAVGALRIQVAALVILEGILIAVAGVAVGVPLGWCWIRLLAWWFDKLFFAGVVLSWGGISFGAGGSVAAALLASILPAWSASRVSPLEAMSPLAQPSRAIVPILSAVLGLILVFVDPLVLYGPTEHVLSRLGFTSPHNLARVVKFWFHFGVGLPAVMLGFFLLSPTLVWAVEGALAPAIGKMLGLGHALLRQQLSSGLWRAAGTCTALMVGLAVLIVLQTEGRTALKGWRLPDKFPDMFMVDFTGIDLAEVPKLQEIPGIQRVMPIAIVAPDLPRGFLGMAGLMFMPDRTMFIGIDPDKAFKMMELDFREGNVTEAQRLLKQGRHIIVTTEFKQLKGLGVGDKLPLKTDHGFVPYTIAGVVWSPGIEVIVSAFDMSRQMDQRTSASIFGTIDDAERDFGVKKLLLFAADLDASAEKDKVLKDVQLRLRAYGMRGGDVRRIKQNIENAFYNLLLLVSTVAFAAMAVASLGVTNTIMASIRTRRWEFGVLRSIGVTRSQLLRVVLAEAVLLAVAACALGVVAGLEMSVNAEAVQVAVTGYKPPIFIPWNYVALGMGIVLLVSIIASLWPAIWVATAEPLELLQAGRAAT